MKTEQILMCVVALILGVLLANMLKSVCGCKLVEGQQTLEQTDGAPEETAKQIRDRCMEAAGGQHGTGAVDMEMLCDPDDACGPWRYFNANVKCPAPVPPPPPTSAQTSRHLRSDGFATDEERASWIRCHSGADPVHKLCNNVDCERWRVYDNVYQCPGCRRGESDCGIHGSCNAEGSGVDVGECVCRSGYSGTHCQTPPRETMTSCLASVDKLCNNVDCERWRVYDNVYQCPGCRRGESDCGSHGSCNAEVSEVDVGECICRSGYSGTHCQTPPNFDDPQGPGQCVITAKNLDGSIGTTYATAEDSLLNINDSNGKPIYESCFPYRYGEGVITTGGNIDDCEDIYKGRVMNKTTCLNANIDRWYISGDMRAVWFDDLDQAQSWGHAQEMQGPPIMPPDDPQPEIEPYGGCSIPPHNTACSSTETHEETHASIVLTDAELEARLGIPPSGH